MSKILDRIKDVVNKVHCVGENPPTEPVNRGELWRLLIDVKDVIEYLEENLNKEKRILHDIIGDAHTKLHDLERRMPPQTSLMEDLEFMDTIPDEG